MFRHIRYRLYFERKKKKKIILNVYFVGGKNMKYLKITKQYFNDPIDYGWFLSIKDGYINSYKYRKSNMLADKLLKILFN